jgi:hypothetical protein
LEAANVELKRENAALSAAAAAAAQGNKASGKAAKLSHL